MHVPESDNNKNEDLLLPEEEESAEAHGRCWTWCETHPAARITLTVIAILAAAGAAYAITGGLLGFGTVHQAIIHFYTHLTVSTAILGVVLPTLALTALTLYTLHQISSPCSK